MSASIISFLQKPEWDDRLTKAVGDAFDETLRTLHGEDWPLRLRAVVANEIIQVARMGEGNPARLSEPALRRFHHTPGIHASRSHQCLQRAGRSRTLFKRATDSEDKAVFAWNSQVWQALADTFQIVERTSSYLAIAEFALKTADLNLQSGGAR